jgi:ectoine hydroxylase-related dioxygenase (phytanoyl-CoA dioxygenase family)
MMLHHLPNSATVEEATEVIREHGHVIIDQLVSEAVVDQILADMRPYTDAAPFSENESFGTGSQRVGNLIARSETGRALATNPLVVGVVRNVLSHSPVVQIGATEMISLKPGCPAQFIHQDEVAFDSFPFPDDYIVSCNTLWALTDFTEENGATRVVPGSHARPRAEYSMDDTLAAEMARGSVMIFTSKLWHAGGSNQSNAVRRAQAINYCVGWVRQEENQFLACPPDIARTLPDDLLKLMGYEAGFSYGHAGGWVDPLTALRRPQP